MTYKTKHRKTLIEFFKKNKNNHYSIQEVHEKIKDIPVATLYRLIDNLTDDGLIIRLNIDPGKSYYYQYANHLENEHSHIHLICEKCGKIIHLDCTEVHHFINHIEEEHKFNVNIAKVNLYGLCEDCRRNK